MDIRLEWNDSFSIDDPLLDAQHRELIAIANSIPENDDRAQVRACVMRLFRYAREHFSAEEEYMRAVGYPRLKEHARIHEALIEELGTIARQPLGTAEADLAFKRFVLQWFCEHILVRDKDIVRYARGRSDSDNSNSSDVR
ncbi:MAG TPA: hemerythrin family protein [Fibrobacteria bacterium]|nr:hemerythrin family protein [Fibrobacteria bacterium]HOX50804.1 hemerythrin family protein [Fibrobacteria bacterium]